MAKQSKTAVKKSAPKKAVLKKAAQKKAAAKLAAPTAATNKADSGKGKLHGKKAAFLGTFGRDDKYLPYYKSLVVGYEGIIVDKADPKLDYLFVGEGRGGKPPTDVAKLQKKLPALQVIMQPDIPKFLLPTGAELERAIRCLANVGDKPFWDGISHVCSETRSGIDLRGADLQGSILHYAEFRRDNLGGNNLNNVQAERAYFGKLDDCSLKNATLTKTEFHLAEDADFSYAKMQLILTNSGKFVRCNFQNALLEASEIDDTKFLDCNFSGANLSRCDARKSKFTGSNLSQANLSRADLTKASLAGTDLRNANLREALLADADLTGAKLDGADFHGAVLQGAKFDKSGRAKAKNLDTALVRQPGPKLIELAKAVEGARYFKTSAKIELGDNQFVLLEIQNWDKDTKDRYLYTVENHYQEYKTSNLEKCGSLEQGFLDLTTRWLTAPLRLDGITTDIRKPMRKGNVTELALQAWAETFGLPLPSQTEIAAASKSHHSGLVAERDRWVQRIRKEGVKVWNDISPVDQLDVELDGCDFQGANLDGIDFWGKNIRNANFKSASMIGAKLVSNVFQGTDFSGAKMMKVDLDATECEGAKFSNVDLTGSKLRGAKLQGTDFTGAKFDKTNFKNAQYDDATIWPQGFSPTPDMKWKGKGPRGGAKPIVAAKPGSLDFDTFLKDLGAKVESARMDKAGSMLKAERFQLFAEVKDTGIVGIVKSQSSGDLVYSCRLNSDGAFGCCTQNLRPCGGLRGALCKHLLVLIVGLAKAGQLDPATVNLWVDLSGSHKPAIEEDSMSATFLRYKGAESGEIDWRPTETIPEDFYAM